jgi:hypothetical protein
MKVRNLVLAGASLVVISAAAISPASAQTTTSTDPDTVLNSFQSGTNKLDDIAGAAAAVGMASCIFGGASLIFKRFIYS